MRHARRHLVASALLILGLNTMAVPAVAQTPPIRIVVGFPPGGSADVTARVLAEKMQASLGTTVIVENKAGAGGRVAAQAVKDAVADGHTLMLAPFAVMVVQPIVFRSVRYDTSADFTPLGNVVTFPLALAAGSATSATTMKELLDWLRATRTRATTARRAPGRCPTSSARCWRPRPVSSSRTCPSRAAHH